MLTQPLAIEDLFGIVRRRRGAARDEPGAPPTAPHRRSDHPARVSTPGTSSTGLPRASFASFGCRARAFHRERWEPRLRRHAGRSRACRGEAGLAAIDEALFNAKGDHARHLDFAREAIRQGVNGARRSRTQTGSSPPETSMTRSSTTRRPMANTHGLISRPDLRPRRLPDGVDRARLRLRDDETTDRLASIARCRRAPPHRLARRPPASCPDGRSAATERPDPRRAAMALEADLPR